MSEQENPSETLDQVAAPVAPSAPAADAPAPAHTSEATRIARSSPERRRALCAAHASLSGTPGQSEAAAALLAIADHADELERSAFGGQAPATGDPFGGDEETDEEYTARRIAELTAWTRGMLEGLAPMLPQLRQLAGTLSFKEQAAIHAAAQLAKSYPIEAIVRNTDGCRETVALAAFAVATELEALRSRVGGVA